MQQDQISENQWWWSMTYLRSLSCELLRSPLGMVLECSARLELEAIHHLSDRWDLWLVSMDRQWNCVCRCSTSRYCNRTCGTRIEIGIDRVWWERTLDSRYVLYRWVCVRPCRDREKIPSTFLLSEENKENERSLFLSPAYLRCDRDQVRTSPSSHRTSCYSVGHHGYASIWSRHHHRETTSTEVERCFRSHTFPHSCHSWLHRYHHRNHRWNRTTKHRQSKRRHSVASRDTPTYVVLVNTVAVRTVEWIGKRSAIADLTGSTIDELEVVDRDVREDSRADMCGNEYQSKASASSSNRDRKQCPESTKSCSRIGPDFRGDLRVVFEVKWQGTISVPITIETERHATRSRSWRDPFRDETTTSGKDSNTTGDVHHKTTGRI